MAKNPSDTWFFNDWENDPNLKACSLAAQGLWKRLLCIAARSPERGVVQIGSLNCSRTEGLTHIASAVGHPLEEIAPLLDELITSGAASVDRKKRVYCRRMVRGAKTSEERGAAGREGAGRKWGPSSSDVAQIRSQRLAVARTKGRHTKEEWAALVEVLESRCVKCGVAASDLHGGALCKDHIKPIYQGGSDGLENLQPMCRSCNSGKGPEAFDYRDKCVPDWRERLAKRLPGCLLSSSLPSPNPLLINPTSESAQSASASPDGPPRSPLPDSAKWKTRLDNFQPWLGAPGRIWQASWGLPPDSSGTNPLIPALMLTEWKQRYALEMAKVRNAA